jgi:hypothetical protein
MIRDGESTEAPYLTATISTMNSPGMDRKTSTTRIIDASTSPPSSPEIAPNSAPMTMAIMAAKNPTSSAACPPFMMRASSSYPWLLVPSG